MRARFDKIADDAKIVSGGPPNFQMLHARTVRTYFMHMRINNFKQRYIANFHELASLSDNMLTVVMLTV